MKSPLVLGAKLVDAKMRSIELSTLVEQIRIILSDDDIPVDLRVKVCRELIEKMETS